MKSELSEFVHEHMTRVRDVPIIFRQGLLGYFGEEAVRLVLLTVASQQQKSAGESLLGRIE